MGRLLGCSWAPYRHCSNLGARRRAVPAAVGRARAGVVAGGSPVAQFQGVSAQACRTLALCVACRAGVPCAPDRLPAARDSNGLWYPWPAEVTVRLPRLAGTRVRADGPFKLGHPLGSARVSAGRRHWTAYTRERSPAVSRGAYAVTAARH
jgi:hypothetical protein